MQITKQIVLQVLVVLQMLQEPRLLYSNAERYKYNDIVMVLHEEMEEASTWTLLKPFTLGLWGTTAGFMIYTALVVWLLEQGKSPGEIFTLEFFGRIWTAVSRMPCTLNRKIESKLARVVIAIWILVMLVLTSSYIANFTSMLNAQTVNVNELLAREVTIGYLEDHIRQDYLNGSLGIDLGNLKAYKTAEECAGALSEGPNRGGVEAILMDRIYAFYFLRLGYATYNIPAQPEADTPRSLGVEDFLVWFIITGTVSTLALIKFFLFYSLGIHPRLGIHHRPRICPQTVVSSTVYPSSNCSLFYSLGTSLFPHPLPRLLSI